MKTLKELIVAAKCRKGQSEGTTKQGAFWLACEPIEIRRYGGDGIGDASADCTNYLHLRHFRDGTVKAAVNFRSWHQNHGTNNTYRSCDNILDCTTIEDVIVCLKHISDDGSPAYSDRQMDYLITALTALGLTESAPAPDEE